MRGTYILIIKLENDKSITIGKLGELEFKKGYYTYVGSALNGLEQRIERHLRKNKKIHWHIDYLLRNAKIVDIHYKENKKREECNIANTLSKKLIAISDFGCSDCKCNSHLFYGSQKEIIETIDAKQMIPYNFNEKS